MKTKKNIVKGIGAVVISGILAGGFYGAVVYNARSINENTAKYVKQVHEIKLELKEVNKSLDNTNKALATTQKSIQENDTRMQQEINDLKK